MRSKLAKNYCLDTWIGLPESEHYRVATLLPSQPSWTDTATAEMLANVLEHDDRVRRAITMNGAFRIPIPTIELVSDLNRSDCQSHEIPAANCISTARSLAKLYAAAIGTVDGRPALLSDALRSDALTVRSQGDPFFGLPGVDNRWGLRFQVSSPIRPMLSAESFGHDGAGGELAFADHSYGFGFAYTHNQMGGIPDVRANDLVDTLKTCLT
jgi:CubicO group peptidase (beta-lactamase class C family)